jgi:hypothetical protein
MQTKEPAEAKEKAPPSTAELAPPVPEKAEGPARAAVARAPDQQPDATPPARAAALLAEPEPGVGVAGQAQRVKRMQRSVGNARVGRLVRSDGAGQQRAAAAPADGQHDTEAAQ